MSSLVEVMLKRIQCLPERGLLSARDLLHLGSRSAVNQAFSRLPASQIMACTKASSKCNVVISECVVNFTMLEQVESVDDFFEAATRGGWMVYVIQYFPANTRSH